MRKIWQNMLFAQIFLTIYYIMFSIETLLYSFCISRFSFTDTDDSQGSRGMEGMIFIALYHFQPPTNVQSFICNFAYEMTRTYFIIALPACCSIRFNIFGNLHFD